MIPIYLSPRYWLTRYWPDRYWLGISSGGASTVVKPREEIFLNSAIAQELVYVTGMNVRHSDMSALAKVNYITSRVELED